jgi:transcriptional regulator with XRE-family HTH domain
MKQIGEVIREYRMAMNLTQGDVASRLGVTAPAVNKWENGNSMPDISLLPPLAKLLNISVDTLLSHDRELPDAEEQTLIYSGTERLQEAYKRYEELLFEGYQSASMSFQGLYILALQENDFEKAHYLARKIQALAQLFEFGAYHEIAPGLELATLQKNEADTLRIMEGMLANLESIQAFTRSPLYAHMEFKEADPAYFAEIRSDLLRGFQDEETYGYLKDNQQWRALAEMATDGSEN